MTLVRSVKFIDWFPVRSVVPHPPLQRGWFHMVAGALRSVFRLVWFGSSGLPVLVGLLPTLRFMPFRFGSYAAAALCAFDSAFSGSPTMRSSLLRSRRWFFYRFAALPCHAFLLRTIAVRAHHRARRTTARARVAHAAYALRTTTPRARRAYHLPGAAAFTTTLYAIHHHTLPPHTVYATARALLARARAPPRTTAHLRRTRTRFLRDMRVPQARGLRAAARTVVDLMQVPRMPAPFCCATYSGCARARTLRALR